MGDDTPRGDEKGPKVDCVAAPEGGKDFEVDNEGHVDGKGEHGNEDGGASRVWRQGTTDDAAVTAGMEVHDAGFTGIPEYSSERYKAVDEQRKT